MPNRNRKKGDNFEYRTKAYFEREGWYIIRHPASAFPDLIAIKLIGGQTKVKIIECKVQRKYFSPLERTMILELAARLGAEPILAYRVPKPPWQLILETVLPKNFTSSAKALRNLTIPT